MAIAADINIGILYFLAVASTSTIAVLMAGWSSNNKYALLGAMRTVAQMISYEIPLVFSIIGVVMLAGTLQMSQIVAGQEKVWYIILQPLAFLIFLIAGNAELNRGPFDLVEGEQEMEIENAAELRSFLDGLDYFPYTSDGLPEYSITFDDGTIYDINLSSGWVWKWAEEEAKLTGDLLQELRHFCK